MDLSKFSYKKDDSEQEPKTSICYRENEEQTNAEDRQINVGDSEANNVITASNVSPDYQKGDSFREPSLIFIISGGVNKKRKIFSARTYKWQEIHCLKSTISIKKKARTTS